MAEVINPEMMERSLAERMLSGDADDLQMGFTSSSFAQQIMSQMVVSSQYSQAHLFQSEMEANIVQCQYAVQEGHQVTKPQANCCAPDQLQEPHSPLGDDEQPDTSKKGRKRRQRRRKNKAKRQEDSTQEQDPNMPQGSSNFDENDPDFQQLYMDDDADQQAYFVDESA